MSFMLMVPFSGSEASRGIFQIEPSRAYGCVAERMKLTDEVGLILVPVLKVGDVMSGPVPRLVKVHVIVDKAGGI
jgi:hypothetical protein